MARTASGGTLIMDYMKQAAATHHSKVDLAGALTITESECGALFIKGSDVLSDSWESVTCGRCWSFAPERVTCLHCQRLCSGRRRLRKHVRVCESKKVWLTHGA